MLRILVVVSVCAGPSFGLKIPSYVEQCYRNDPNLSDCILRGANAALPYFVKGDSKYGIPPVDPLHVDEVLLNDNDGDRPVSLKLKMKDAELLGIGSAKIHRARIDKDTLKLTMELTVDRVAVVGQYEVSGRILLLPIHGKGKGNVTLQNVNETWEWNFETVTRNDGLEYLRVKKFDIQIDTERLFIKLENLFGGDKRLGNHMNKFLNENWKEVYDETKMQMFGILAELIMTLTDSFLTRVPLKELFPYS